MSMTDQEMLERFAHVARARLEQLLRLKVPHIYESTPGEAGSVVMAGSVEVGLRLTSTRQGYAGIERFAAQDKEMGFVVNPGLVPLVKAIVMEVRGRRMLVTRRIAGRPGDPEAIAHVDGYGVRLALRRVAGGGDSTLEWECLFGVA